MLELYKNDSRISLRRAPFEKPIWSGEYCLFVRPAEDCFAAGHEKTEIVDSVCITFAAIPLEHKSDCASRDVCAT